MRFRAFCALPTYQTGEVDRGVLGGNGTTSPNELVVTGPSPGEFRGTTPFIGKFIIQFDQKKCEHKICLVEDWTHDPRIACGRSNHSLKPCRLAKEQRTRHSCHPAALQIAHVLPFYCHHVSQNVPETPQQMLQMVQSILSGPCHQVKKSPLK